MKTRNVCIFSVHYFTTLSVFKPVDMMTDERRNGKDLEGSGLGLIDVVFRYLSKETKEIHKNPHSLQAFEPSTSKLQDRSIYRFS